MSKVVRIHSIDEWNANEAIARRHTDTLRKQAHEIRRLRDEKPFNFAEGFVLGLVVILLVSWVW